jgi:hypothetical protein
MLNEISFFAGQCERLLREQETLKRP